MVKKYSEIDMKKRVKKSNEVMIKKVDGVMTVSYRANDYAKRCTENIEKSKIKINHGSERSENSRSNKRNENSRSNKRSENSRNNKSIRNNKNKKFTDSENEIPNNTSKFRITKSNKTKKILTQDEKHMLQHGALLDRINMATLVCTTDPSNLNMKNLLQFVENQRNDTIYYVLKNIRDLMIELQKNDKMITDGYIIGRVVKSYEINSRNKYIGEKTLVLAEELARAGVLVDDMISIIISNLNNYSSKYLSENFSIHRKLILSNLEDFFFKNDTFRAQHNALKLLRKKEGSGLVEFYNTVTVDEEYKANERELLYESIIGGMVLNMKEEKIDDINKGLLEYMRNYRAVGGSRVVPLILKMLNRINDSQFETFLMRNITRFTGSEVILITEVEEYVRKNPSNISLLEKVMNNVYMYGSSLIMGMLMLCNRYESIPYSIWIYRDHYDENVREICARMIRKEKVEVFDTFDVVELELRMN